MGVRNPDDHLARLNWFARRLARMNVGMVGTPVSVSATGLTMSLEEVLTVMVEGHEAHQSRPPGGMVN